MLYLLFVFIIAAAIIAIWSATKPAPDKIWIAVILLCIVEAIHSLPSGVIR